MDGPNRDGPKQPGFTVETFLWKNWNTWTYDQDKTQGEQ